MSFSSSYAGGFMSKGFVPLFAVVGNGQVGEVFCGGNGKLFSILLWILFCTFTPDESWILAQILHMTAEPNRSAMAAADPMITHL